MNCDIQLGPDLNLKTLAYYAYVVSHGYSWVNTYACLFQVHSRMEADVFDAVC